MCQVARHPDPISTINMRMREAREEGEWHPDNAIHSWKSIPTARLSLHAATKYGELSLVPPSKHALISHPRTLPYVLEVAPHGSQHTPHLVDIWWIGYGRWRERKRGGIGILQLQVRRRRLGKATFLYMALDNGFLVVVLVVVVFITKVMGAFHGPSNFFYICGVFLSPTCRQSCQFFHKAFIVTFELSDSLNLANTIEKLLILSLFAFIFFFLFFHI